MTTTNRYNDDELINIIQNKIIVESRLILSNSNIICNNSNKLLNATVFKINLLVNNNSYQFYIDSIRQQLRLLDILKDSLNKLFDEITGSYNANYGINEDLVKNRLENILDKLKSVKGIDDHNKTLYHFINQEEVNMIIHNNSDILTSLENDKNTLSSLISSLTISINDFNNKLNQISSNLNSIDKITANINKLIESNNALEQEMALILESLTNHYDQCLESIEFIKVKSNSSEAKLQIFKVLENDYLELPLVYNDLMNINKNLESNCDQIENQNLAQFNSNYQSILNLLDELKIFGLRFKSDQLVQVNKLSDNLKTNLKCLTDINSDINSLVEYYELFIKSFKDLKVELQRRKLYNSKIKSLINEFNIKINNLAENDSSIRHQFLAENGDYLPKNIVSDNSILYNDLPKVEVKFEEENIPDIN
ncbi:hypothetical protein PACTADRAFT_81438 [Pachysolen tannophilus NRRL Y-2460]|uniref:Autophagy-related protein 17 n=1 Tax=Pachysolen tannophilus NRRL Y-2460 TaxID=669874 RepID=A0A1E4TT01_PACTA|nr:hypothetical protein PACTADRAFT_81438 [Pachysolen tannophilus NRRL Y-2460]